MNENYDQLFTTQESHEVLKITKMMQLGLKKVHSKVNLVFWQQMSKHQWYLLDREGHGHKAAVYKSHFLPLRHSVVTETPARYLANKPCLSKGKASLLSFAPMTWWQLGFKLRSQDY